MNDFPDEISILLKALFIHFRVVSSLTIMSEFALIGFSFARHSAIL
jgi:hypothetical protein